jgi:hypothetical protein
MITDRFVRNIWAVNGVIFLGFFLLGFFSALVMVINEWTDDDRVDQIIVGEKLEQAKGKGLALQGLEYSTPFRVYRSTGYVLPVQIRTYVDPKKISDTFGYDSRHKLRVERRGNTVNVIFLDENFQVERTLLDRKAFINTFDYPTPPNYGDNYPSRFDTTVHHIVYDIAFEDSDKNGAIDEEDDSDLYISDLDGANLIKVSNNVAIQSYEFRTGNVILFSYHKRDDTPEEHKRKYFARYFIKEKKNEELTSIDKELDTIEAILTK